MRNPGWRVLHGLYNESNISKNFDAGGGISSASCLTNIRIYESPPNLDIQERMSTSTDSTMSAPGNCRLTTILWLLTLLLSLLLEDSIAAENSALPSYDRVRLLDSAVSIDEAELLDHDGQSFKLSELRGKVALILFGFTNCPDVCPMGMERMRQLDVSGLLDPEKIAYVLISVDGERDSPAVIKKYVQGFSPRFIGLTGDPEKVKPIAKNFSASFFPGNAVGSNGDYSVSHSPQIFVLDPAGQLRAEFYSASVDAMTGVALALLQEADELSSL